MTNIDVVSTPHPDDPNSAGPTSKSIKRERESKRTRWPPNSFSRIGTIIESLFRRRTRRRLAPCAPPAASEKATLTRPWEATTMTTRIRTQIQNQEAAPAARTAVGRRQLRARVRMRRSAAHRSQVPPAAPWRLRLPRAFQGFHAVEREREGVADWEWRE